MSRDKHSTHYNGSDLDKSGVSRCCCTSARCLPARGMCCPCSAIVNDGTWNSWSCEGWGCFFYLISQSCHLGILAQSQAFLSKHFHRAAMVCANSFHLPFVFPRVASDFPFSKAEEVLPQSRGEVPWWIRPSIACFSLLFPVVIVLPCPSLPSAQLDKSDSLQSDLALPSFPSCILLSGT